MAYVTSIDQRRAGRCETLSVGAKALDERMRSSGRRGASKPFHTWLTGCAASQRSNSTARPALSRPKRGISLGSKL
jgi:hypothetical protein